MLKVFLRLSFMYMPVIPAIWMLTQEDCHEFSASLDNIVSSRPARTT